MYRLGRFVILSIFFVLECDGFVVLGKSKVATPRKVSLKVQSYATALGTLRGGFLNSAEFFADAGFFAAVIAPVVKSEIILRLVSLSSSFFFLTSGLWTWPKVNWVGILAQFVFIARSGSLLHKTISEKRIHFTTEEIRIYHQLFDDADLQLYEYKALLDAGSRLVKAKKGEVLVAEDGTDWGFMLLTKGNCKVMRRGRQIDKLVPGDAFGDKLSIAAKTKVAEFGPNATATIIADADDNDAAETNDPVVEYLCWDTTDILQMMAQRVTVRAAILAIVARDEARRINRMDWDDVRETKRRWFQPAFLPPVPVAQIPTVIADSVVEAIAGPANTTTATNADNSNLVSS